MNQNLFKYMKTSGPKSECSSWVLATIHCFLVIKLPCGSGTMPAEKVNLKSLYTCSNAHLRNSGGGWLMCWTHTHATSLNYCLLLQPKFVTWALSLKWNIKNYSRKRHSWKEKQSLFYLEIKKRQDSTWADCRCIFGVYLRIRFLYQNWCFNFIY
jgi:hypothetical protein